MSPKVIFIDWDGTLSKSRFWEHWLTEDPGSYAKVQQVLFTGDQAILHDWMHGYVSSELVVSEVAHRSGLDYRYLISNLEKSCKAMVFLHPHVIDSVRAKRDQGIKVVIATDNMDTFHRWTVPALELEQHFDGILNSVNRSALKEEFADDGTNIFFHHYLNQNSLKPEECLLIDDRDMSQITKFLGMNFTQVGSSFNVVDVLKAV